MIRMVNIARAASCVAVISSLAGCGALDPVNMILSARASSYDMAAEMTSPQMRDITLKSLRTADCPSLAGVGDIYQEDLKKATAKADRTDIAVAQMNISVVKQIQAEKSCPAPKPLQAQGKTVAPAVAPAPVAVASKSQGTLDLTIDSVPPAIARSLGLADAKGALVVEVNKGSAADKAGIKPLDVILEVNGQRVATPADFDNIVSRMRPGYKAPLRIRSGGKTRTVSVTVGKDDRPAPPPVALPDPDTAPSMDAPLLANHGWLGLQYGANGTGVLDDVPQWLAGTLGRTQTNGVLVGGALPGAALARAGLQTLDIIVSLNGRQIDNRAQLGALTGRMAGGTTVKLGVWRNRKLEFVQVTLDAQATQLTLPFNETGYCFAWINADTASKNGAITYEFVVSAADAAADVNPVIGAQFKARMVALGLGADIGEAPGVALCRTSREAITKLRETMTTVTKNTFAATRKDTIAVYWIPR